MEVAISLVLPIFGIIGLGYAAVRSRLMSDAGIDGLDVYVFTFGIPSLLFRNLSHTVLPDTLPWGLWISYYGAMLAIWAAGSLFARFVMGRPPADAVILGFGGGQGNVVMLGIPIILTGFGPEAGAPLFLLLAFHGLILITTATLLLEMTRAQTGAPVGGPRILLAGFKASAKNPIIIGLGAGLIWGQTGVALPGVIDKTVEMVSLTAIPCALFVLGGTLTRYHIRRSIGAASMAVTMKLVVHPALVFALTHYVFGLDKLWVAVATVLAGMPTGVYSSILANRYQAAPGAASSAVVMATGTSIVTLTLLLNFFLD
ncbi:MAG: AEC family transporter [Parvibaculum sp.]|uniref:AEC family transporter n=1 Tax=Parvibaculum sp. TaxID=2024848 RepID=UPI0025E77E5C|nr:AEC family transporter [Parvibaculum sp.]MCE9651106.1 AEC family transporter [Parvibaculum sp.]